RERAETGFEACGHSGNPADLIQERQVGGTQKSAFENGGVVVDMEIKGPWTNQRIRQLVIRYAAMAPRPETETGIVIVDFRSAWDDAVAASVSHDRAVEGRRVGRECDWRRPERTLRQRGVAEPTHELSHRRRDDQRTDAWNDDGRRRRLPRWGWPGEFEASRRLTVFKHFGRQRSADRKRIQACHARGCTEMQNLHAEAGGDRELHQVAHRNVSPIKRESIHTYTG